MDDEAEVQPGDRITVELGTDAVGSTITGTVVGVSYTTELDTDTVLADDEGAGFALIHRVEVRIAGTDSWIDITDAAIKIEEL